MVTAGNVTGLTRRVSALRERYVAAQLAGDQQEAIRLLLDDEGVGGGMSVVDVVLGVIQPAQYEIGRLWQENRITVAQEHLATAISQLAISRLYPLLPREARNGQKAIVACVEGERHDLGARVTADFLEMAGYDVRYLGPDVPTKDLVRMVTELRPNLLALSVTIAAHLPALREAVERVCEATGGSVPVAVGGGALAGMDLDDFTPGAAMSCSAATALVSRARERLAN